MRPILFEIPLPRFALPLGITLSVLALGALLLLWFGLRRRAPDLVVLGALGAVSCAAGAVLLRGQHFTPSSIPVMSYGALLALSLAVGWWLTLRLAERAGLARDASAHAYVMTAIFGLIGARLLYVATNPSVIEGPLSLLGVGAGGLAAYGGFLGGFAGAIVSLRRQGVPFFVWADAAVPSVALGLGITRVGCYLYGCDFGRPLAGGGWLSVLGVFPRWRDDSPAGSGSPAWVEHVRHHGLSPVASESLPVHPTQLYEAVVGLALFALAIALHARRQRAGQVFLWIAFVYGACRFLLEFLRDDPERGHYGPALPALFWVAAGFAVLAAAYALSRSRYLSELGERLRLAGVLGVAVLLVLLLSKATFAREPAVVLSTSQWLGLGSALAAAWVLRRLGERAPSAA